jgi:hypothetical protein
MTNLLTEARRFGRFTGDLWRYLGREFPRDECRAMLAAQLRDREQTFLELLERAVYARPSSPYRALLLHVGAEHGDVAALVRDVGLEDALVRLHGRGVYLTLEEFTGHRAIVRPGGLELPTRHEDFDNPVLRRGYAGTSGGSRRAPRRTMVDFGHFVHHTAYHRLYLEAFGLYGRPAVLWRPAPPAKSGFSNSLRTLRLGLPVEWYSQNHSTLREVPFQDWLALRTAVVATRFRGPALPLPRHVPLDRAEIVARRLAELVAAGTPAVFQAPAGSGVRVALAAAAEGLDLTGTAFRLGGEPLTRAKLDVVERVGAVAHCNYSMSELGRVGIGCAEPDRLSVDDVHVLTGKVAIFLRPTADGIVDVPALVLTSLDPTTPKLMLNVESGDTGVLAERDCGCAVGKAGYRLHLHTIRSYDKLTSEGTNFLGGELMRLVEDVLPARFGGSPTDYQFVEDEQNGLPRVRLFVSPRVGVVDDRAILEQALGGLGEGPGYRQMMAGIWRDGVTLTVERSEPFHTATAKIPALHVLSRP